MTWLKDRFSERTSWDGTALIATGVIILIAPTTIIAYAAIAWGVITLLKSED
jgi:hypothetical protein